MKLGVVLGLLGVMVLLGGTYLVMSISTVDEANDRLEVVDGVKSKVEVSLDNMNKIITSQIQVTKGEKDAFLEFQALVASSKKGQSLGGIMTQVQEKYPKFEVKGFEKLMSSIEIKRDEFAIVQNQYNSHVTEYNRFIVKTLNKMFLDETHVKLEQFVVSSKKAKVSMETGEDDLEEIAF